MRSTNLIKENQDGKEISHFGKMHEYAYIDKYIKILFYFLLWDM